MKMKRLLALVAVLALAGTSAFGAVLNYDMLIEHGTGSAYANAAVTEGGTVNELIDGGGFSTALQASKTSTYTFTDAANGITFGFDVTVTAVNPANVDAFGNGFSTQGNIDPGDELTVAFANVTFSSTEFSLNSATILMDEVRTVGSSSYDINIDTDGNTGNGYEIQQSEADAPHVFTGTTGISVQFPGTSSKTDDFRISRLGWTVALDVSGPVTFSTTPGDDFIVQADYPATLVTNSVAASYTKGFLGTDVQITAMNISNDPSNAFNVVTSLPFTLPNPSPSNSPLEIAFDATAATNVVFDNATEGFTITGAVDVVWTELGSGTLNTNALTLIGRYRNPRVDFNYDNNLSMSLVYPTTAVTNDISVSYVQGRPGHTNVQITAIDIVNASTNGFSTLTSPFTLPDAEPSNSVVTIVYDNSGGWLANKESATANVVISWKEAGGSITNTATNSVSVSYLNLPSGVIQQDFSQSVDITTGTSVASKPLSLFGELTNKWWGVQVTQDFGNNNYLQVTSGSNTRRAINLVENGTAGADNFGPVDTEPLTNGLYRYDFTYAVEGINPGALWSIEAYTLIGQVDTNSGNYMEQDMGDAGTVLAGPTSVGGAYAVLNPNGKLSGSGDVAKTNGSVIINVQDGDDALLLIQSSQKRKVQFFDLTLTRIGEYDPNAFASPTNAVLDATFTDPSVTNAVAHYASYDYNDAGANFWAHGKGGKWNSQTLEISSTPTNSRSFAIVTRAGTAGYDDVGVNDTIALTSGVYTVSVDVDFSVVTNIGHGSITIFSFAGVDTATGNVNDVRLSLQHGTNVAAGVEANQVPMVRGTAFYTELARDDYTNDVTGTLTFTDLAVQDGEDLGIRWNCYFGADFNAIDNVQVLRTGDAPPVGYAAWVALHGLSGNDALLTTDVEPDGLDNLLEYALDGDPNADDGTGKPSTFTAMDTGTNWFYHVHNERTDDPRLSYEVGRKGDLVFGTNWTTGAIKFVDESPVVDNVKSVTNRTDIGAQEFIRLKVERID